MAALIALGYDAKPIGLRATASEVDFHFEPQDVRLRTASHGSRREKQIVAEVAHCRLRL
jgi:hypothetical protein